MSENTLQKRRETALELAKKIDETASAGMTHFLQVGSLASEIQVAQAMVDMRAMMTAEVMAPIMALQNTDIGFRTDRIYPLETVRDVVIEAKIRGFNVTGNEFNIIAGRLYIARNGFRRKLTDGRSFKGLNNFRDIYEVPRCSGVEKELVIKCSATWSYNGVLDTASFEFPVKVNNGMGSDGALGKAERKLCKRVHDFISGINTPDGDLNDVDVSSLRNVTPASESPGPKFSKKEKPEPTKEPEPKQDPTPTPFDPNVLSESQKSLETFVVHHSKLSFDTFKNAIGLAKNYAGCGSENWASFADVPDDIAKELVNLPLSLKLMLDKVSSK